MRSTRWERCGRPSGSVAARSSGRSSRGRGTAAQLAAARQLGRAGRRRSRPPRARPGRGRAAAGCGGASWTREPPCAGRRGPCRDGRVVCEARRGARRTRAEVQAGLRGGEFRAVRTWARSCERGSCVALGTANFGVRSAHRPQVRALSLALVAHALRTDHSPCRSYAPLPSSGAPVSLLSALPARPTSSLVLVAHLAHSLPAVPSAARATSPASSSTLPFRPALAAPRASPSPLPPSLPPPRRRSSRADPHPRFHDSQTRSAPSSSARTTMSQRPPSRSTRRSSTRRCVVPPALSPAELSPDASLTLLFRTAARRRSRPAPLEPARPDRTAVRRPEHDPGPVERPVQVLCPGQGHARHARGRARPALRGPRLGPARARRDQARLASVRRRAVGHLPAVRLRERHPRDAPHAARALPLPPRHAFRRRTEPLHPPAPPAQAPRDREPRRRAALQPLPPAPHRRPDAADLLQARAVYARAPRDAPRVDERPARRPVLDGEGLARGAPQVHRRAHQGPAQPVGHRLVRRARGRQGEGGRAGRVRRDLLGQGASSLLFSSLGSRARPDVLLVFRQQEDRLAPLMPEGTVQDYDRGASLALGPSPSSRGLG